MHCIFKEKIMSHTPSTVTLSVRIAPEFRDQLEELAVATGRTKSFLTAEAIESYLTTHAWQVNAIKQALKKADGKKAHFVNHDHVSDWLNRWGTDTEQDKP
jgi:RHH-type rel operon transcriptional repressor/antitoxin RelB